MKNTGSKKFLKLTIIGAAIMFCVVLLTGIFGLTPALPGFKHEMAKYGQLFTFQVQGLTGYACIVLLVADFALLIFNVVRLVMKKRYMAILTAVCLFLSIAFLPLLIMLAFHNARKDGRAAAVAITAILILANLFAVGWLSVVLVRGEKVGAEAPVQQGPAQPRGLSELEIRAIIEDYIALHEEEMHSEKEEEKAEPAPAPAPVEEPKEEPAPEEEEEEILEDDEEEEEEEEEEVEVVDESGQTIKIKRKKRTPFESKLRRSEYDIRHKYYDLRDYIKWYGLNNRISIPGDSFSYKRRKYAFITIVGKHIKFFVALDPDKYENSPIPVERATAKKYIDTPCVLRIKSDLSYRRAKILVDDAMREAGIAKPEGEAPKETQHLEKK